MRDEDEATAAAHRREEALEALEAPTSASVPEPELEPAPEPAPAHAPTSATAPESAPAPSPQQPHRRPLTSSNVSSTAAKSPAPRGWLSSVRRPRTSPGPKASALKRTRLADGDARRDSALTATASDTPSSPTTSLHKAPSLPAIVVQQHAAHPSQSPRLSLDSSSPHLDPAARFHGIDLVIPTGSLEDLGSSAHISFSKRGSMLLGGTKANRRSRQLDLLAEDAAGPSTPPRQHNDLTPPSTTHLSPSPRSPSRFSARRKAASYRVLSVDEMMLSRKVRSMYKHGDESAANWDTLDEETKSTRNSLADDGSAPATESLLTVDGGREDSSSFVSSTQDSGIAKEPFERAGGVEDWTDLEDAEVDRYGFIVAKKSRSRGGTNGEGMGGPDQPQLQRVSTALQLVSAEPRRRRAGRSISRAGPLARRVSQKSEKKATSIFSNHTTTTHRTHKSLRHAANKLPHNRDRRLLDEASDMLRLPPGLAEIAAQKEGGKAAQTVKAKEIQRDQKWRRMAKVVESGTDKGGGMLFEFDTKDTRLINRTWKGIPDRWRAAAWWSFLSTSAKRVEDSPTDKELIESFYQLQAESSAEDVQIDVDVPRTINRHIMFRRRYRGGQRLLFRVLHAMSLYLPDTGYVQGMAPLAATLLCYYEEDKAFVMLVRLWMLRGLERLYESGFSGLMDALADFEQNWLREGDVAKKLDELGITATAWGTRWYLTLFNYSLPFPAQLRVWDVFMLLGDASYSSSPSSGFSGDLDVLHATSAALIDATREILLDSDFENVMKVLTSGIPVKDEELLMRVAKVEYRMRKKRANA